MTESGKKQLLIIGNGFDLACGLKSSYSDFFEWRFKGLLEEHIKKFFEPNNFAPDKREKHSEEWNMDFDTTRTYKITNLNESPMVVSKIDFSKNGGAYTLWDLFFLAEHFMDDDKKLTNWCDIESFIRYVVTRGKTHEFDYMREYLCKQFYQQKITNDDLLKELSNFERSFKDYMKLQIVIDEDGNIESSYPFDQSNKLKCLTGEFEQVNVLSFNYTPGPKERDIIKNYRNIHNSIVPKDGHIIFGIDAEGITPDDDSFRFTKTYRIMANSENGRYIGILDDNIDTITFYGHSLAEADFSYFESIFDYYNIYSSDVTLEFYCVLYGSMSKIIENNELRRENYKSICNLLYKYGESIGGMRGKNLVHKLLLENRLKIHYENKR